MIDDTSAGGCQRVVAGHRFNLFDYCQCGRKWQDLEWLTHDQFVDKPDLAHASLGSATEYAQIVAERARRARQLVAAYGGRTDE